jgi:hypothetical protein
MSANTESSQFERNEKGRWRESLSLAVFLIAIVDVVRLLLPENVRVSVSFTALQVFAVTFVLAAFPVLLPNLIAVIAAGGVLGFSWEIGVDLIRRRSA